MKNVTRVLPLLISLLPLPVAAGGGDDMKPYPEPDPSFDRMVFRLPAAEDESAFKVEIVVGKTLSVDCNKTSFGGTLERRVAEGWGYPYYVVEKVGGPMTTMMACPPGTEKREAFVSVRGDGFLQRYNSKLPVVVFVPRGFQVRYRLWAAQEQVGEATPE